MSWRSSEATEVSNTPQVSSNQLDLSQIFQNFFHQKKINVSIGWPLKDWHVKSRLRFQYLDTSSETTAFSIFRQTYKRNSISVACFQY